MSGFGEFVVFVVVCVDVGLVGLLTEETPSTVTEVVDCPVIENINVRINELTQHKCPNK